MIRSTLLATLVSTILVGSVVAQECAPGVQTALDNQRRSYVEGMAGVASSNFSMRPGTFGDIACLDRFMKGDMDVLFRPTDLNSLLDQIVSFACDKIESAIGDVGDGGVDALALVGDMSRGTSFAVSGPTTTVRAPSLQELFR